jgi:hypothetical protein
MQPNPSSRERMRDGLRAHRLQTRTSLLCLLFATLPALVMAFASLQLGLSWGRDGTGRVRIVPAFIFFHRNPGCELHQQVTE